MKQKVTIEDVAKHCQVSKSSVSRYLNHGYVSQEHKEKIRNAIEELGFERDFLASRLKAKHTRLIGVVMNDMQKQGHEEILTGIRKRCIDCDYHMMIAVGGDSDEQEKECLRQLLAQGAEGVILLDCADPAHLESIVKNHHAKVVFANGQCMYAPFLDLNEKQAGSKVGTYCLEKNACRFAYVETNAQIGKQRRLGFASAFGAAPFDMQVISAKNVSIQTIMNEIVAGDYDVILCEDKGITLRILRYCHEVHIHVPQNISLICFGDGDWCETTYPSTTALSYHYESFGGNLAEEMIAIMENRAPQWQEIAYDMMERESMRSY